MPPVTKSLGEGTQSTLLTAAILKEVAYSGGEIGISETAKKLGTSKSRVYRHVQTLVACDFLTRSASGDHYTAGLGLIALSRAVHERHDIVASARPVMEALHEKLGHTVIISRVERHGVRVLQSISLGQPIVLEVRSGSLLPFDSSAQGLVAMSHYDPSHAGEDDGLEKAMRKHGRRLAPQLDEIRKRGWATAQMREGLLGVAAPILDGSGKLVATLALLNTAVEMERSIRSGAPRMLMEAASDVARLATMSDQGSD